jgi:hypothetical protein
MEEEDYIKVERNPKKSLCHGCAFNLDESSKCYRPDNFSDCWDEDTNYIFKERD